MCQRIFSRVACGLSVVADLFGNCGARVVEIAGLEWGIGIHKINLLVGGDVLVVLAEAFECCSVVVIATIDAVGNSVHE